MIDPIAFQIPFSDTFVISIHWYGIIIAVGLLLAILLAMHHTKREGHNPDNILDLALIVVPLAVICARAYYVIFQWSSYYSKLPFTEVFAVWHGGLAIYGGVIGGFIGVWIYTKFINKKIPFTSLLDILAPSLVLGQAIGRWGNFVNQEAYGAAVLNPAWQWFPAAVFIQHPQIAGEQPGWYMATFFYESMWNFLVFAFLYLYFKNSKTRRPANVFWFYLLLYGIGRAVIEGLRTDSLYMGDTRVSQLLAALLVVASAAVLGYQYFRRRRAVLEGTTLDDSLKLMTDDDRLTHDEAHGEAVKTVEENTNETAVDNEESAAEEPAAAAADETAGEPAMPEQAEDPRPEKEEDTQ